MNSNKWVLLSDPSENHLALKTILLLSNAYTHGGSAVRYGIHVERQRLPTALTW